MHPAVKRALILILIGAISLGSVWTSTNRWISGIFGIGGMLLIISGLFVLSAWAEQKEKERLSDEYDPDFKYSKKRLGQLSWIGGIFAFISFGGVMVSEIWFNTLFNKLYFALLFGILAATVSWFFIMKIIAPKVPEMQVAHEDVGKMILGFMVGIGCCIYLLCLSLNYKTAETGISRKVTFVVSEKEEKYTRTEAIELKITAEDQRTFPTSKEIWESVEVGDSVEITVKKGIFGFEHFLNFEPKNN